MSSKDLVIGMAVGVYAAVDHIRHFIISLRKYYNGKICIIVDVKDAELIDFLKAYDVDIFYTGGKLTPESVMYNRWILPRNIITEQYQDVERVLLPDTRDVVFQGNPFDHFSNTELQLSVETKKVSECPMYNSAWIRNLYGIDVYEEIKDNMVLCAGITGGTRDSILKLCEMLIEEYVNIGTRFVDQAALNVFYHRKQLPSSTLHLTGGPMVATIGHSFGTTILGEDGYLTGDHGIRPAMVHQYDRHVDVAPIFHKTAIKE